MSIKNILEFNKYDEDFYYEHLADFLPEKIIDIHAHIWLDSHLIKSSGETDKSAKWPELVAKDNSIQDLIDTYKVLFPAKAVVPLMFGFPSVRYDTHVQNEYVSSEGKKNGFPTLGLAKPEWDDEKFEAQIKENGFLGCKVYLNYAPSYIPENEIRIFDFLPQHQLEILNKNKWIVMLHIPRQARLKDPVNLNQIIEIENRFPDIKLIIAHVGRAYCAEDIGGAFEILKQTNRILFDFSANCNETVFKKLISTVGEDRILFGSDLPILRMKAKRICKKGNYINLVPPGIYKNVSNDKNMRETSEKEAETLTFLLYESILAFKKACQKTGLASEAVEKIFYKNALKIISGISGQNLRNN